jgi:hypothetical protein
MGCEGGIAIAEALKINTTITDMKCGSPSLVTPPPHFVTASVGNNIPTIPFLLTFTSFLSLHICFRVVGNNIPIIPRLPYSLRYNGSQRHVIVSLTAMLAPVSQLLPSASGTTISTRPQQIISKASLETVLKTEQSSLCQPTPRTPSRVPHHHTPH